MMKYIALWVVLLTISSVYGQATFYPNPTTDVFSLANVTFSAPRGIAIYNTTGMLMKEYTTSEADANQFSVSELVQGTYFVQIQSSKGNQLLKLVKQ